MPRTALIAACVLLGACTTLKFNDGGTTTIEYHGDAEAGKELANRACHKAGDDHAEVISTANKDPSLPAGTGTQVITFSCSATK